MDKEQLMINLQHISEGQRVLIAFSAGPDSMALFDILYQDSKTRDYELCALHFNHGLRPEATIEADQAVAFATSYGINCEVLCLPVRAYAKVRGCGIEGAGHVLRHKALQGYAKTHHCDYIALGHHADDQAETILMHMLRGSGLNGLTGMKVLRGNLLRPLLQVRKKELLAYCQAKGLAYVTDGSNGDTNYLRNDIRSHIIPELERLNPKAIEHFVQMADCLQLDEESLQAQTKECFDALAFCEASQIGFWRKDLAQQNQGQQRRLLQYAVNYFEPDHCLTYKHIRVLEDLLASDCHAKEIQIGKALSFWVNRDRILLEQSKGFPSEFSYLWDLEQDFDRVPYFRLEVKEGPFFSSATKDAFCLPKDKILRVRSRQTGDVIYLPGLGRKAVKKIFQESGMSPLRRRWWPLVCDAETDDVLWIPRIAMGKTEKAYENGKIIKIKLL